MVRHSEPIPAVVAVTLLCVTSLASAVLLFLASYIHPNFIILGSLSQPNRHFSSARPQPLSRCLLPSYTHDQSPRRSSSSTEISQLCVFMSSRMLPDSFQVVAIAPNMPGSSAAGTHGEFTRLTIMSSNEQPRHSPPTEPSAVAFVKGGKRKRLSKVCNAASL
jgi:hypothetical protein